MKLAIILATTMLGTTLAFAQTSDTQNSSGAGGTPAPAVKTDPNAGGGNAGTSKMDQQSCNQMMAKAHAGTDFTDAEAAPYISKMDAMKISTKTKGKITAEEFMAACEGGAFQGM